MRLFIAINFTSEVKDAISETIANLRSVAHSGSYTAWDNLHLTLAFIGETDRVNDIVEVMTETAQQTFHEPLQIRLSGAGTFKRRGGDTHWIAVHKTPVLEALADRLADNLREAGFPIEKRRFIPHITIGRNVVLPSGAAIMVHPVFMSANSISLMQSRQEDNRTSYTELASVQCRRY